VGGSRAFLENRNAAQHRNRRKNGAHALREWKLDLKTVACSLSRIRKEEAEKVGGPNRTEACRPDVEGERLRRRAKKTPGNVGGLWNARRGAGE